MKYSYLVISFIRKDYAHLGFEEFLDGVKKRWLFYHQVARLFFWCAAGWMSDLQAIHSMSVGGGVARGSRVFDRFGDRFGRRLSYGFLG